MPTTPDPRHRSLIGGYLDLAGAPFRRVDDAVALDPARVAEFNQVLAAIAPEAPALDAALIERMARELRADPGRADSIARRLEAVEGLKRMAGDPAWRLPGADVARIDVAIEYLSRCDDLIPDDTPGIGLLDDAIVIELAHRMLERELADYADFCRFRDAEAAVRGVASAPADIDRRDWLAWKRASAGRAGSFC